MPSSRNPRSCGTGLRMISSWVASQASSASMSASLTNNQRRCGREALPVRSACSTVVLQSATRSSTRTGTPPTTSNIWRAWTAANECTLAPLLMSTYAHCVVGGKEAANAILEAKLGTGRLLSAERVAHNLAENSTGDNAY
jgi:hypothetical protein